LVLTNTQEVCGWQGGSGLGINLSKHIAHVLGGELLMHRAGNIVTFDLVVTCPLILSHLPTCKQIVSKDLDSSERI
jgi:hypothetical protein